MTFIDPEKVCEGAQQYLRTADRLPQFQDPAANGTLVETPYGVGVMCGVDSQGRASVQLGSMRLCINQAQVRFLPEKMPLGGPGRDNIDQVAFKRGRSFGEEATGFSEGGRKCKRPLA
mmetsp:Transcript_2259/g.1901  ORF Transcript_2259/g.1901 Transcript_2259/m.1901 type:complete len:118 (-) Transcript_2259:153-506(-)